MTNERLMNWCFIDNVEKYEDYGDHFLLYCNVTHSEFKSITCISFPSERVFRMQVALNRNDFHVAGQRKYKVIETEEAFLVSTSSLLLEIRKNPFQLFVYTNDGKLIAKEYTSKSFGALSYFTDGLIVSKIRDAFHINLDEKFYGFGERFNGFNQRGRVVDIYVYDQPYDQEDKTYFPIPFFIAHSPSQSYGVYVNSTFFVKFDLGSKFPNRYEIEVDAGRKFNTKLDYYFIYGSTPKQILMQYTNITGKPILPPKWVFGLWMSNNNWNTQAKVMGEIQKSLQYKIRPTVLVIEAWSDEATFYIFNDARYIPKKGNENFSYKDFVFPSSGKWPDPKALIDFLHDKDIKVLFWQIPVLKYMEEKNQQRENDESYMITNNFCVLEHNGDPYRNRGLWFNKGLIIDFTNPNATKWWLSKRTYLFDDLHIDGFKTDGGEHIFGEDLLFFDGRKGSEMHNAYPNLYLEAYYKFVRKKTGGNGVIYSRSGSAGAQAYSLHWAGDQRSTWQNLRRVLFAGLSASMSGISFWGWDFGGFCGEIPTAELYLRSVTMATFCPIMQYHTEHGSPDRTPWNVQEKTQDHDVIAIFCKYVNLRMNLLPYIYSEAKESSISGIPLMRPMILEYPADPKCSEIADQYFFGSALLVAPVIEKAMERKIYLPNGDWIDFWTDRVHVGPMTINYHVPKDIIPVFIKDGSIIPMILDNNYRLGTYIQAPITKYAQLVFKIYPKDASSFIWYDDSNKTVHTVKYVADDANIQINLPSIPYSHTLIVRLTRPKSVTCNGSNVRRYFTLDRLKQSLSGWYYDQVKPYAYIKLKPSNLSRLIIICCRSLSSSSEAVLQQ